MSEIEIKQQVYDRLNELGIEYRKFDHEAVYTMEEGKEKGFFDMYDDCKNLFLRDAKGRNHFMIIVYGEKKVDLKDIRRQIETSQLSFASNERMDKYLGVTPGSVSPFALLNDKNHEVKVCIDKEIIDRKELTFHPNLNTSTVVITYDDLMKFIKSNGNEVTYVDIK